ncbi:MAG: hypothetical protein ACRET3_10425 [Burkholderiales bacterium]
MMRRYIKCLVLAALAGAVFIPSTHAQERRLEPVDEATRDLSWALFKNRLLDAVMRRDRKFVLSVLERNVRVGVDGARGITEFSRQWHLYADDSRLWRELASALFAGAAWLNRGPAPRELCAPYVLARWPRDLDPHAYGAIISRDALVKAAPSSDSQTLVTLAYDIVAVADWEVDDRAPDFPQKWVKIKFKTGEGYVPEEQIRSPIEYTACFVKTGNGWRMSAFAPAGG